MFSQNKRAVLSGLVAVFIVGLALTSGKALGDPQGARILYENDHTGWKVHVVQDEGCVVVGVSYEMHTPEGIRAYVTANETLADTVFDHPERWVPVLVTFDHPMAIDRFGDLMAQADVQVESYALRAFDRDGNAVTIGGEPQGDVLVPEGKLRLFAEMAAEAGRPYHLAGVIWVIGEINRDGYRVLTNSEDVFLVDVTRGAAQEEAQKATGLAIPIGNVTVISPYPMMERLGWVSARP